MVLRFRVNAEEAATVRRFALEKGMTVSGYLRWSAGLKEAEHVGRPIRSAGKSVLQPPPTRLAVDVGGTAKVEYVRDIVAVPFED